ncbi:MAG: phosphate/phosphite/phosphonate ABC transporter substrate-binding protein [Dongiaceae bacterium]
MSRGRSIGGTAFFGIVFAAALVAATGSGFADWRDETKVLRVGYLSTGNPAQAAARMDLFRSYLESRIGLPVELVPAITYAALIDGTVGGRIQYAIHSATSYVVSEAACTCIEPLAVPAAFDGSVGFHSILLVRADSPIRTLADASGATIAVSGEDSLAGRLVPFAGLAGEGIDAGTYFSRIVDAPGPEAAITALLAGDVDVAAGWSSLTGDASTGYAFGVLTRMVIDGRLSMDAVRVLWRSPIIPFGPHAVRTNMASELKLLLADALFDVAFLAPEVLEAVDRSGFGGGGFVAIDPARYAVIAELIGGE